MIRKCELLGKTEEQALNMIYNDKDYSGTTEYSWLNIPVSFDNVYHYIRIPSGTDLSIQFNDDWIIEKVW